VTLGDVHGRDAIERRPIVDHVPISVVRNLPLSSFAIVMATGIVSVGLHDDGHDLLSRSLLLIGVVIFVVLVALHCMRLVAHRRELIADLTHPASSFGFYTFVAACGVLASRLAGKHQHVALGLLVLGAAAWLVRGYAQPWSTRLGAEEAIIDTANGTWFMWAVGAQSIAVAASGLAPSYSGELLPLVAVVGWSLGLVLYVVAGIIVVARIITRPFSADDLAPPYWIAMGGAAITALAGADVAHLPAGPFADAARDDIRGGSLLAWALATWLLPALVAAGWWRHARHRVPLRYETSLWSIVFPLGMYAVACTTLGRLDHLPYLTDLGSAWIWVAFAAWLSVAAWGLASASRPRTRWA
jgi:tellurite resistance protein TehA-like permease